MKRTNVRCRAEICNCAALRQATRRVTRLYDDSSRARRVGREPIFDPGAAEPRRSEYDPRSRTAVGHGSLVGHLLRPLEKHGFVKLEVSEHDRRSRLVALTRAGKAAVDKALPRWAAAQRRFESTFGKEVALEFRTVLKEIATAEYG